MYLASSVQQRQKILDGPQGMHEMVHSPIRYPAKRLVAGPAGRGGAAVKALLNGNGLPSESGGRRSSGNCKAVVSRAALMNEWVYFLTAHLVSGYD